MNETSKTFTYLGIAVVLLAVGWWVNQAPVDADSTIDDVGKFFPDFNDPQHARTLQIVRYDEEEAAEKVFRVTQVDGVWSLPSHENYPADADRQLAEAAAALMDIDKLAVVTDDPSEHEVYGVVDPENVSPGAEGVGTKVTLEDAGGKKLVQFVIGKQVPDQAELHYVRLPSQDRVYRAEIDVNSLSTDFSDWIEPDLLKLNAFDVSKITVNDHSVDELNQSLIQRGRFSVANEDNKWQLLSLQSFQRGKWVDVTVPADEELNDEKLDAMKRALDDLKIVNVSRKPAGLSGNLRTGEELLKDAEAVGSLRSRGFYAAQLPGSNQLELFSNEGEVRCGMNTGVEYVLRFGAIAGRGESAAAAEGEEPQEDDSGLTRYLFVLAEFNPALIEKPEPPKKEAPAAEADDNTDADAEANADADEAGADEEADADQPADEAEQPADDAQQAEQKKQQEAEAAAKKQQEAQAEVAYNQAMEVYNEKVKAGEELVKELNDRFADWYYIISDKTYTEIHLTSAELLKKKAPAEEAGAEQNPAALDDDTLQQFEQLRQGLDD